MSIEFPLKRFHTKYGVLYRPMIPVFLQRGKKQKRYSFILDSGAEFTMVPRRIAPSVGLDIDEFTTLTVEGIEGRGIDGVLAPLAIRIADERLTVRCFFANKDDAPFLLGRADLFNCFNILFDAKKKQVVFNRV